jgi:hypothetical protein
MKTKTIDINQFVNKLNQAESIINELRDNILLIDTELQESIARGEKDISKGKITICKTKEDLNNFFSSI